MFSFLRRSKQSSERDDAGENEKKSALDQNSSCVGSSVARRQQSPKDVINLLIPEDYGKQRSGGGVSAFFQRMKKKHKNRKNWNEANKTCEVTEAGEDLVIVNEKNEENATKEEELVADEASEADFVKALVLERYVRNKTKREIKENDDMGTVDSRQPEIKPEAAQEIPEIVLECEESEAESDSEEIITNLLLPIKSNLKSSPSDDESSVKSNDSNKKKVTFKKTIDFDDGDILTDDEVDSTFESLSSNSSEDELSSDEGPDNDEHLGGDIIIVNKDDSTNISCVNSNNSGNRFDSVDSDIIHLNSGNDGDAFEVDSFKETSSEDEPTIDPEPDIMRNLVNQEGRFQEQVSQLTELAATRSSEADSLKWKLDEVKRELEVKDAGAERLRAELASAHKEAELVRQRLKFLENELSATRSRSTDLSEQLAVYESSVEGATVAEVDILRRRIQELEKLVQRLELEKKALFEEKKQQEARAEEATNAVAACESRWRRAHEKARSEASERAERVLADCEWKMRDLEKRAREADRKLTELTNKYQNQVIPAPAAGNASAAELSQLRGLSHEQQRALRAAGTRAAAAEQREAALAQDLMRLRELIDRDRVKSSEIEAKYKEELSCQDEKIRKRLEDQRKAMLTFNQNSTRLEVDRVRTLMEKEHLEKQRSALQQQRNEHEWAVKCVERRLKEAQARLENLKDVVAKKESQFEHELAEARSTADWDLLQLRHLLDRADIKYATTLDAMEAKHEKEIEKLNEEWTVKIADVENASEAAVGAAKASQEAMRMKLVAERLDQINKLTEKHKIDMAQQWEEFMYDKEHCLARMKTECRLEGEEESIKREKEMIIEIKEMKAEITSKSSLINNLKEQLASKERRFNVTDQELRDAMAREQSLRTQLHNISERTAKSEQDSKSTIDYLTRKCACLTKLFEEMRARLEAKDAAALAEKRKGQEDLDSLRAEVSRLTALLAETGSPGDRTSADGCDSLEIKDSESADVSEAPSSDFQDTGLHHSKERPQEPRRKGGGNPGTRQRAKSVDLPAVQVPVRIKQFDSRKSCR